MYGTRQKVMAADITFGSTRSYSDSGARSNIDYHGTEGGRITGAVRNFWGACGVGGSSKMVF